MDVASTLQNNQQNQSLQALASYEPQNPVRILRLPEVMSRVGLCRASVYQQMVAGTFPRQIPLGLRAVGWLESEISAWLFARIHARMVNRT